MKSKLEPGQDGFVEQTRAAWAQRGCSEPRSMLVIEYCGTGDPMFGGTAEDRALGVDGELLCPTWRRSVQPVEFETVEAAHMAAKTIKNRRADSLLGIAPKWR